MPEHFSRWYEPGMLQGSIKRKCLTYNDENISNLMPLYPLNAIINHKNKNVSKTIKQVIRGEVEIHWDSQHDSIVRKYGWVSESMLFPALGIICRFLWNQNFPIKWLLLLLHGKYYPKVLKKMLSQYIFFFVTMHRVFFISRWLFNIPYWQ